MHRRWLFVVVVVLAFAGCGKKKSKSKVAPLEIVTTSLPDATEGSPYSYTVQAQGGNSANYSWSATGLPSRLSINPTTGVISGTPDWGTSAGSPYSVVVTVTDGTQTADRSFSLVVNMAPFEITTSSLPDVAVGAPYWVQLEARGGRQPYSNWRLVAGQLPPGLSINPSSGEISGYPTAGGTYSFTVAVDDGSSPAQTVQKGLSITVKVAAWTVMVYINGDNNLEEAGITDINEMEESGGSTSDVNIVVQFDRHPDYDTSNGNWTTCKRFYVKGDSTSSIASEELADLGEVDMCAQATLQDFLEWAMGRFKAQHYALVLWNHGMTWMVYSQDETDNSYLTWQPVYNAIYNALQATGLQRLDLLGFDMCLVGCVETLAAFYDVAEILVMSAETEPGFGWDYKASLGYLRSNPAASGSDLASRIVNDYAAACRQNGSEKATLIALDTANAAQFLSDLDSVAQHLQNNISSVGMDLGYARYYADTFSDTQSSNDTAVGLADLLYTLYNITSDTTLQANILLALQSLTNMVIESYCGSWHQYSGGFSIFFPKDYQTYNNYSSAYQSTWLASQYSWDDMLVAYYVYAALWTPDIDITNLQASGTTATPSNPVQITATLTGNGIVNACCLLMRQSGSRLYFYMYLPIQNTQTLPNGKEIGKWHTSTAWSLSWNWDAKSILISDGTTATFVGHDVVSGLGYVAYGRLSVDGGTMWYDCEAYFDISGNLLAFQVYVLGLVVEYIPQSGDLFQPLHTYVDTSSGGTYDEYGASMAADKLKMVYGQVASGTFLCGFYAEDLFGGNDMEWTYIDVP